MSWRCIKRVLVKASWYPYLLSVLYPTYICQTFITFFHKYKEFGRAFTVCLLLNYYFFKQIRTLQTCNLIPGTTVASLFYKIGSIFSKFAFLLTIHFEQISKY